MNEFLRQFVMKTIFKMIDVVPEWQVREYALGWYTKGILTEEDLVKIEEMYNKPEEPEETGETVEENAADEEPSESEVEE